MPSASSESERKAKPPTRTATVILPPLFSYQERFVRDVGRDVVVVSCTQAGKTYAAACWIIAQAMTARNTAHVLWWVAPVYSQLSQGLRIVLAFAKSAGLLRSATMTPFPVVTFVNGAILEFRSAERSENLQGTTVAAVVIDEAGLLVDEAWSIISTRRSHTLGPARFLGNPGAVSGPFRRICSLAEEAGHLHRWTWRDKHRALLASHPGKACEYVAFVEQERRSLPAFEFSRLYCAEWSADESSVFPNIDACIDRSGTELLAPGSDDFVIGVDPAMTTDYCTAVSFATNARRLELRFHRRGVSFQGAAQELMALSEKLDAVIVLEMNGLGIGLYQELQRLGAPLHPFTTSAQSKQEIVLNLAADVQERRVVIADHAPMPTEFSVFNYQRSPSGLYRYGAPSGSHDDTVMAACLARWGAGRALTEDELGGFY